MNVMKLACSITAALTMLFPVTSLRDNPLYPLEKVQAWQKRIPRSELLTLAGDSYHIAATAAAQCARATLEFIRARS